MKTRDANELLRKIQKGATAGFNTQDWVCCLEALGWLCTKILLAKETCYNVTAPNGAHFTIRKEPGYRVVTFYNFLKWAKTNGLADAVEAKIGPAPRKPTRQEVEANTGTCSCCFGGFKLKDSKSEYPTVVFHGYKRPGTGYTLGVCYGAGYAPYEVSCLGTEHFLDVVRHHGLGLATRLATLRAEPEQLLVSDFSRAERVVSKDSPDYAGELRRQIESREAELRQVHRDCAFLEGKMRSWEPTPLPGAI